MNQLSLSIAWNDHKHQEVTDVIDEVRSLGFSAIELNYKLPAERFDLYAAAVGQQRITVPSIHNYCPIPEGYSVDTTNPDIPSLASIDEATRQEAVASTKRTLQAAQRVKAKAIVVHSGRVESEKRTYRLIELSHEYGIESKEFLALRAEAIDERGSKQKEHFDALCTSYAELIPVALDTQVVLGVENRFHYCELPNPRECSELFRLFATPWLQYWHDVGHAFIHESLGFYPDGFYLESFYKNMVGMHIHDIMDLKDHQAPFTGDFNWYALRRYDLSQVIKVIEVQSWNSADDIRYGAERFENEVLAVD